MPANTFYVKFFAPVTPDAVNALMQTIDRKIGQGAKRMGLLISSPGGDVFQGLSAYNYLRGVPLEIVTHNFGSVDSVGVILYCAGSQRLCVPNARFVLHGVMANLAGPASLEESQLDERLKGLQLDMSSIAHIIGGACRKEPQVVLGDMRRHLTLSAEQAVGYGLAHEIKQELYEAGSEVISIQMGAPVATAAPFPPQTPPQGFPPGFSFKPPQN